MYFKITNEKENHNGLQYNDGLVKDIVKFNDNPKDSCCVGGIYFSDVKHISDYFHYGPWIRQIELPEGAQCVKDPQGDKWRADKVFLHPRRKLWDIETFKWLIDNGLKPNCNIVGTAIDNDNLELFKFLYSFIKTQFDVNELIDNAYYSSDNVRINFLNHILRTELITKDKGITSSQINLKFSIYDSDIDVVKLLTSYGILINKRRCCVDENGKVEKFLEKFEKMSPEEETLMYLNTILKK